MSAFSIALDLFQRSPTPRRDALQNSKPCPECEQEKPLDDFYLTLKAGRPDYRSRLCKLCQCAKDRARRARRVCKRGKP